MKNRNLEHKNEWKTPQSLYDKLNKEFNFDFDPCPLYYGEITPDRDGLLIPWGKSNFINPPYSRNLKEGFIKRAIEESKKGAVCVMLLPVSTSTNIFHKHILPNASEIRFIYKRVSFEGINTFGQKVGQGSAPMHDSMIVVFRQAHRTTTAIQNCFATSYEQ
jgi:site-specific DNA-methyltransferase (adenine-specific)